MKSLRQRAVSWFLWSFVTGLGPVGAPAGGAQTVAVEVRIEGATQGPALTEIPILAEAKGQPTTRVLGRPGSVIDLELLDGVPWGVRAVAEGFWSETILVEPLPSAVGSFQLRLYPSARLAGHFAPPPGGASLPTALRLALRSPPATATGDWPALEATVECPVEAGRFTCRVPAVPLDLRLEAPPFAPFYFWRLAPLAGNDTDLGRLTLAAGASLSGRLELPPSAAAPDSPTLELAPVSQGVSPDVSGGLRTLKPIVGPDGFFQLTGLSPGTFSLTARLAGSGQATLPAVTLAAGEETRLAEPLRLEAPASLAVVVSPATDAYGQAWRIALEREDPRGHFFETVAEGAVDHDGAFRPDALAPGAYGVQVRDPAGSTWLEQPIALAPGANELFLEVPLVAVEGSVRLGDEPASGKLWFGGTQAARRITFELGEEGEFSGYLPEEGTWPLELESPDAVLVQALEAVLVRVPDGETVAEIEIRLPDTRLAGRVVDGDGDPVAGANLTLVGLRQPKKRREALARSDGEGRFELRGLSPGEVVVQARKGPADSGWQNASIHERLEAPELTLVLEELLELSGRVVAGGQGVAGALLLAQPDPGAGGRPESQRQAVSGPDGSFRLQLPRRGTALTLWSPPFALRLLRLEAGQLRGPLELELSSSGGRLLLDLTGELAATPDLDQLLLVRGGSSLSLLQLLRDLRLPTADVLEVLAIPAAEDGTWAFCNRQSSRCASGYLAPGSELLLGAAEGGEARR